MTAEEAARLLLDLIYSYQYFRAIPNKMCVTRKTLTQSIYELGVSEEIADLRPSMEQSVKLKLQITLTDPNIEKDVGKTSSSHS